MVTVTCGRDPWSVVVRPWSSAARAIATSASAVRCAGLRGGVPGASKVRKASMPVATVSASSPDRVAHRVVDPSGCGDTDGGPAVVEPVRVRLRLLGSQLRPTGGDTPGRTRPGRARPPSRPARSRPRSVRRRSGGGAPRPAAGRAPESTPRHAPPDARPAASRARGRSSASGWHGPGPTRARPRDPGRSAGGHAPPHADRPGGPRPHGVPAGDANAPAASPWRADSRRTHRSSTPSSVRSSSSDSSSNRTDTTASTAPSRRSWPPGPSTPYTGDASAASTSRARRRDTAWNRVTVVDAAVANMERNLRRGCDISRPPPRVLSTPVHRTHVRVRYTRYAVAYDAENWRSRHVPSDVPLAVISTAATRVVTPASAGTNQIVGSATAPRLRAPGRPAGEDGPGIP